MSSNDGHSTNGHAVDGHLPGAPSGNGHAHPDLRSTPLLPDGYKVPASRWVHPSTRLQELLRRESFVFAPGVYDPFSAQQVMYHGYQAVYFSGYSFAMGHVGSTDMDLYGAAEIADGARRTVAALRKFQLTMAVGDPDAGVQPRYLDIPPVVVDMDGGYGNAFNVQRTAEMYVNAGVAGAHIEDQVLPKRCGHIAGKALIDAGEMIGKLRMIRAVADENIALLANYRFRRAKHLAAFAGVTWTGARAGDAPAENFTPLGRPTRHSFIVPAYTTTMLGASWRTTSWLVRLNVDDPFAATDRLRQGGGRVSGTGLTAASGLNVKVSTTFEW